MDRQPRPERCEWRSRCVIVCEVLADALVETIQVRQIDAVSAGDASECRPQFTRMCEWQCADEAIPRYVHLRDTRIEEEFREVDGRLGA